MLRRSSLALLLALVAASCAGFSAADEPASAEFFGFKPLELYKLDNRISVLTLDDYDGDKAQDIAVANNARSRIDLFLTTPGASEDPAQERSDANRVVYTKRMRLKTLPVNKEVVSIAAGDFDGDKRVDLAYYGTPAELVLLKGDGKGEFRELRRYNTGEAVDAQTALQTADLNRDGRTDLVLMMPNEILTFLQREDGRLAEPERTSHTAAKPGIMKSVDLDGDGGDDLVLLDSGDDDPIRVRFSTKTGGLGPEQRFAISSPRAIAFADMDGKPGQELLAVEGQSGRVRIHTLAEASADDGTQRGHLLFYPLPAGESRGRALAVGDINGDKKADVVVTDPANAQLVVYLQTSEGLAPGRTFPNLAGGRAITITDIDADGAGEVLVMSEQEKQIGLSRFSNDRLGFPAPLPIVGDPVAVAGADLNDDKSPEVVYVARAPKGQGEGFQLRALRRKKDGGFEPFKWGETDAVPIAGLSGTPPAMRVVDVNKDAKPDLLVFKPFGAPILLLGAGPDQPPSAVGGNLGPLVAATPAGVSTAVPHDAALLVAQNAFARSVVLDAQGQWEVKDQYNAGRGGAQIQGAAALDAYGEAEPEIVLFDRATRSLLFLEERDKVYKPGPILPLGSIEFQGMQVADFDGDGRDDLLIAGGDKFGLVLSGRRGRQLKSIAGYETSRKDAILGDLIAADINGDGKSEILVSDIGDHAMEILEFDGKDKLSRGLVFKIFETKSFRDRDSLVEPRDMAVGDVDGDKLTDLVLICHDRVLIYRQDPGPAAADAKTDTTN